MTFPMERLDEVKAAPNDFQLLERVPWTKGELSLPFHVNEPVGDEIAVVFLDTETTGFDRQEDAIIELGMVKARVSPSTGQVTSLVAVASLYNDPGYPIPEVITDITGITNEMVQGQSLTAEDVIDWFHDDPIVVAHNADFDRPFFEGHFPGIDRLRWACSIKDIPWRELGFEGSKLEYLLLKRGFFYEGHRASIDCLALGFLMETVRKANRWLIANEAKLQCKVDAVGSPFECKDDLKARGYRWDGARKLWHTTIAGEDLDVERAFLSQLYYQGGKRARVVELSSRDRFKG